MAYANWPATVPHEPERAAWSYVPGRASSVTEMEGGDIRQRWRPGDDLGTLQWARALNAAQIAAFDAFLATIAQGAARFVMPVTLDGQGYVDRVVQIQRGFGGINRASAGMKTRVSFTLHVFPASMTPA